MAEEAPTPFNEAVENGALAVEVMIYVPEEEWWVKAEVGRETERKQHRRPTSATSRQTSFRSSLSASSLG